jgi:geranylgeranyl reductase family protein
VLDVVVIGAGPAGSRIAKVLAERGREVLVLEEHEVVGAPVHCTGLLGAEAFAEFGLPRSLILAESESARFWGAAGQSVPVRSDRANAAVIDRGRLDRHLADVATAAGATLRVGCRVDRIEVGSAGVIVTTRGDVRPIVARLCVLACGANYRFHRSLGLGLPDVFLQSAQVEAPFPAMPEIEVRFGREVAPAGFAWMVPFQRDGAPCARIGLMSENRSGERFQGFIRTLCDRAGVDPANVPAPRLKMLPLGPVPRSFGDRVLAVGDAAGLVKPTTGGGIYYGLLSASLAADVADEALGRDRLEARSLRRYEVAWRRRLGQEIRVGLAFRRIAASLSDQSIDELIELARVDGVVPLLERTASFNWHRKAAIALLGHPGVRRIVFRSWARSAGSL